MEALRFIALVAVAGCGRLDFQADVVPFRDAAGPDAACLGTGTFTDIQKIASGSTNDLQTAAFITPDGLGLVWDQSDGTNQHLWTSQRATRADPFPVGAAIAGTFANKDQYGGSLTGDGLELYFDSAGVPKNCIYRATRATTSAAFDPPVELSALCQTLDMAGAQISADGLTLVYSSAVDPAGEGDLYITERPDRTSEFPAGKMLGGLPSGVGYPALSADRLRLWFEEESGSAIKVVSAVRISPSDVFSQLHDLAEIDTNGDEGDPSLTLDESVLTFVSHRDGSYAPYIATRPCL